MTAHFVFGYGSLVNRGTHALGECHPARVPGWRRAWRHVEGRSVAFLTAIPAEGELLGLMVRVEEADWPGLDQRERSYLRTKAERVEHGAHEGAHVHIYHAPETLHRKADRAHPILMSYLDAVVAGYRVEWGADGVRHFFETTDGWDAPVLDDRARPVYPRHQAVGKEDRALVDEGLSDMGVRIIHEAPALGFGNP